MLMRLLLLKIRLSTFIFKPTNFCTLTPSVTTYRIIPGLQQWRMSTGIHLCTDIDCLPLHLWKAFKKSWKSICFSVQYIDLQKFLNAPGKMTMKLITNPTVDGENSILLDNLIILLLVLWAADKYSHSALNFYSIYSLSLIHIWRCRRIERCRSRWSPYH